jgi:hypothetical protein
MGACKKKMRPPRKSYNDHITNIFNRAVCRQLLLKQTPSKYSVTYSNKLNTIRCIKSVHNGTDFICTRHPKRVITKTVPNENYQF